MHAATDTRLVRCLDGLALSFAMLEHIHADLHLVCAGVKADKQSLPLAFLQCWSFVDTVHALAVQPDGRVITAQSTWDGPEDGYADIIERLNPDGSADASFATSYVGPGQEYNPRYPVNKMVVQPDGRVLLGGSFPSVAGVARANLARLNANGTLDTSFEDAMTGVAGSVNGL